MLLCLLSLTLGVVVAVHAAPSKPQYSKRVRFARHETVSFPDFTLRYTGKNHVDSPAFAPGFTYETFVVKAGEHEQEVRWCGGTGVIAPAAFKVNGKPFWLELHHSARLGVLAPDELVIVPARED